MGGHANNVPLISEPINDYWRKIGKNDEQIKEKEKTFYYKKVNNGIILEYIWSRDIQLGLNFYFITSHFLKTYKFVDTGKILMDRCRDIRNYLISYGIDNKNKVSIITNTNEELNIEDSKELIEINGNYSVRIYNKNDNKIKK